MSETTGTGQAEAGQELDARVARAAFGWTGIYQSHINFEWCGYPPGVTQKPAYARGLPKFSTDMNDAMRAAEAVGLFDGSRVLMRWKGPYTETWAWHVMEVDSSGVPQGFVAAETAALAIARAVVAVAEKREGQGEK